MKKRVVVCGSRFGQFYLEAVAGSESYELAGILANGSTRSRACAKRYHTNLYTDVHQLPADIDLACVVIKSGVLGGNGIRIASELMERHISVLLEQPIHERELIECYKIAKRCGVSFQVCNLYGKLPAVRKFISLSQEIVKKQHCLYFNIDLATQVSYPLARILLELFEDVTSFSVEEVLRGTSPFQTLLLKLDDIPVHIRAQNQVDAQISDSYMHLFFQMTLGVDAGSLMLTEGDGMILWRERLKLPHTQFIPGDFEKGEFEDLEREHSRILQMPSYGNYRELLREGWTAGIVETLDELAADTDPQEKQRQMAVLGRKEIRAAKLWHEISNALGYPDEVTREAPSAFAIGDVLRACDLQLSNEQRYASVTETEIRAGVRQLNRAALLSMLYVFQGAGVLQDTAVSHEKSELLQKVEKKPQFTYILERWLSKLTEHHLVAEEGTCYRALEEQILPEAFEEEWNKAREMWDFKLGPERVSTYFYQNALHLKQLLNGESSANEFLFPEGSDEIANDLYRNTLIAWYMNHVIAKQVEKVCRRKQEVTILEIGAGTGATTDAVLEHLKTCNLQERIFRYWYTDLSEYFLHKAQERYENEAWMVTGILDMEKDLREQGIMEESQDILVAAGVLNNAGDTSAVLRQWKRVLKPGGMLLISEAVEESVQMLISQVFMMEEAADERREIASTFLSYPLWLDIFKRAGLHLLASFPAERENLCAFGQRVFLLEKGGGGYVA